MGGSLLLMRASTAALGGRWRRDIWVTGAAPRPVGQPGQCAAWLEMGRGSQPASRSDQWPLVTGALHARAQADDVPINPLPARLS